MLGMTSVMMNDLCRRWLDPLSLSYDDDDDDNDNDDDQLSVQAMA